MPARRVVPASLLVAAAALGVEVLVLVAVVGVYLVGLARGRADDVVGAVVTAAIAAAAAAGAAAAARSLLAGARWARGPVITWHVLQLLVGLFNLGTWPVYGAVGAGLALVVLVSLFTPSALRATRGDQLPPVL